MSRMRTKTALLLFAGWLLTPCNAASAGPQACGSRVNNTRAKLLECVTVEGVREHQAAFQEIADAHGGIRTSGTPGYDESAFYVAERLLSADYAVTLQPFLFMAFFQLGPSTLEQVAPVAAVSPCGLTGWARS